jgi:hypothetical protein
VLNLSINRMQLAIGGIGQSRPQPSFALSFPDAGAGEVGLVPYRSVVSATFTRATTATTVLSSGLIGSVSSGVARSYYDPTSLGYLGYLAEGARTNLLLRSEEYDNASWSKTDTTITADAAVSPDGAANADLATEGTAGTSILQQTVTATADVNYAFSFFAKRGNTDWIQARIINGANVVRGWWDLGTGVVGSTAVGGTGAAVAIRIKAYPGGWYRCELVGSVGSGATAIVPGTATASADANTGRVNNGTYNIWGAQFENNVSFASSYIPTTNATVTRNADVLTYPTTGWYNAAQGTLLVSGQANLGIANGAFTGVAELNDGTASERILLYQFSTDDSIHLLVTDGGVSQGDITPGGAAASFKAAGAYQLNNLALAVNGGTVATDTSATIPTVTTLQIGGRAGASAEPFSTISSCAYYPTRLANGVLQQLTM